MWPHVANQCHTLNVRAGVELELHLKFGVGRGSTCCFRGELEKKIEVKRDRALKTQCVRRGQNLLEAVLLPGFPILSPQMLLVASTS